MNIAFITQALPYLPAQDGFRLYAANLLRSLARRHQIDLISLLTEDDFDHLAWAKEHCDSLLTLPLKKNRDLLTLPSLLATYAWGKPLRHRKRISSILAVGMQSRRLGCSPCRRRLCGRIDSFHACPYPGYCPFTIPGSCGARRWPRAVPRGGSGSIMPF